MRDYIDSLTELSKNELVLLLARRRRADTEGVAVTGLSCRLPGGVDSPAGLWAMVRDGTTVATERAGIPTDSLGRPRWNLAAPDIAPFADALGTGAYLADIDLFDAARFGVRPEDARYLDPQQRLLLTETGRAVGDAGLGDLTDARVGVFVSVSTPEYDVAGLRNRVGADELRPQMSTGTAVSGAAGRIAVGLGLSGPALTVDTACSSALVATHLACAALRRRECDVAIVGASHLVLSPLTTGVFARAAMLSASGRCRPFTAEADGYVRGEGCVVLVLTREHDTSAGANPAYAVIRASATHQHGRRAAMSSPSAAGQQQAIEACLRAAEVPAEQVGYVEAHGSAAKIADRVEIDAIAGGYRRGSPDSAPLYVGSGKANLGYLETTSGAAGLARAILALNEATVPPQPDFRHPEPTIPWQRLSLTVPTTARPWPATRRRLAGVNAYGYTGINAHVLLEAPDARRPLTVPTPVSRGSRHWLDSYTWC